MTTYTWTVQYRDGSRISSQGAHLKRLRRAEGGAKIFGVFCVKNHDFTPKNIFFFPILGGRAPPGSAPATVGTMYAQCIGNKDTITQNIPEQNYDKYAFVFRHVVKHGVESGVTFGVNFEVVFFLFFLFFSKWHFVSFTKIVIIIFCLLKVLFDGLTTLKSMAEVNKKKF